MSDEKDTKDTKATESDSPIQPKVRRTDRNDVPATDNAPAGPTKEQEADAKRRDDLLEEPEDTHPEGDDAPTTDHIPAYGQTHATPGVPYQENPLNPGMNPTILPGADPRR